MEGSGVSRLGGSTVAIGSSNVDAGVVVHVCRETGSGVSRGFGSADGAGAIG